MKEERFVEHTLQLAIQAALDAASHVVSDERLGEPPSNRELFTLLARAGILPVGPDFQLAIAKFVDAEVSHGAGDPAEGAVTDGESAAVGPAQTVIGDILNR